MSRLKSFINEEKENSKDEIKMKIMDFFTNNPNPPDEEIHGFAKKLGLDPDDFETIIYSILGSILGSGKSKKEKFKEEDADPKQLEMGMKVEMEHTDNKDIAKKISLDHLAEIPDYYTRLAKMEKNA